MNNNTIMINNELVDVTTVFDTNVTWEPAPALVETIVSEDKEVLRKFLGNYCDELKGVEPLVRESISQKGWFISKMERHPYYNGNLQIVLRNQDVTRYTDLEAIANFFSYVFNWTEEFYKHRGFINGKEVALSDDEYYGTTGELRRRRRSIRLSRIMDSISKEIAVDNIDNLRSQYSDLSWSLPKDKLIIRRMLVMVRDWILNCEGDPQFASNELVDNLSKYAESEGIKVRFGYNMKVSRIIGKLGKLLGITTDSNIRTETWYGDDGVLHSRTKDYGWNGQFAALGDAINPITIKGTAVLSAHPVDYHLMSNGTDWASCHYIDKENTRGLENCYEGMYCGGTESNMLDKVSFIFYYLKGNYTGDHPELEYKFKRCMFYVGEDKLIQGRAYPDGRDGGDKSLAGDMRNIVQKIISEIFDVPNLWKLAKGTSACYDETVSTGPHYRDYLHYEDCNVSYLRRIDGYINHNVVRIGSDIICPECGRRHTTTDNPFCGCVNDVVCEECGCMINANDAIMIGGDYYCGDCARECRHCGDYFIIGHDGCNGGEYLENYDRYVCNDCLASRYVWSEEEGEYLNEYDAVFTEEGNVYLDSSDSYGVCERCCNAHDIDNMRTINDHFLCEDCAEDFEELDLDE